MSKKPTYEELEKEVVKHKLVEKALRESEATLKSIFRAAPTGIGMVADRVIKQANERLCEMTGYSHEELLEKSARIVYPTDEDFVFVGQEKYKQIRERGTGTVETHWQQKDGKVINVLLSSTPIDPNNLSGGVTFTALDITERKQAEEALRESEERYRIVLEVNPDSVALYDMEGRVTYINPAFEQRFGWNFEEVVGKRIDFVPAENRPETKDAIEKMLSGKKIHSFETRRLTKEGKILDVQISSSLFFIRDGEAEGSIVTLRDITARKQAEEELVKAKEDLLSLSRTDSLTGILNRRAILSQIEIELSRAKREKKELSLSLLDIDHFKEINDSYGHIAGDNVLREVVGRISSSLRVYDSLGRFGGEEFLIIIPGAKKVGAYTVCERIRSAVGNKDIISNGLNLRVTISQGVVTCDGNANVDEVIARADKAMYKAKRNGRNRVEQAIIINRKD